MTSIYIDGKAYDHIIDTSFVNTSQVTAPDWVNQNPEIDTNIWTKKPQSIIYTLRVTDAEKWTLDQLLTAHRQIYIVDETYDVYASIWIRSINSKWEGNINWTNPWLLEIEVVVINMLEGDYTTWALMWKVDSIISRAFSIMSISESNDLILIFSKYTNPSLHKRILSTGAMEEEINNTEIYGWDTTNSKSLLGKYFATVIWNGVTSHPDLKIYKDCVLIQTIDLFTTCGWDNYSNNYSVSFNSSGKYILITNQSDEEYALFVGS